MKWVVLAIIYVLTFIMWLVATAIDFLLFKDKKTRSKTVETISGKSPDNVIIQQFLYINFREMVLFLGGLTVGVIIMWFM